MTSLTPTVFHSAFVDKDPLALDILESASKAVARLIARNLAPLHPDSPSPSLSSSDALGLGLGSSPPASATSHPMPVAATSVLCFGGSLVGVPAYRALVIKHLARMGHVFPHVEFVEDAAMAGAQRLAAMFGEKAKAKVAAAA